MDAEKNDLSKSTLSDSERGSTIDPLLFGLAYVVLPIAGGIYAGVRDGSNTPITLDEKMGVLAGPTVLNTLFLSKFGYTPKDDTNLIPTLTFLAYLGAYGATKLSQ